MPKTKKTTAKNKRPSKSVQASPKVTAKASERVAVQANRSAITATTVLAGIILVFGLFLIIPDRATAPTTNAPTTQTNSISYAGVDGSDALTLLERGHQVETQSSSYGDFVQSIDGVTPDANHFWAFYVNGQLANVGAGAYQTKTGDTITWQLDAIQ